MPRKQSRSRITITISILAVLILVAMIGFDQARKPVEYIAQPFLRFGYNIAQWVKRIPESFKNKEELTEQITTLKEEQNNLIRENSILRTLIEEDTIESRMQNFLTTIEEQGVQAYVIGKPTGTQQILLIDKGEEEGIRKGQAVITNNGFLIGTILSATQKSSRVMLVTDSSQSIAAKIQNKESSPGVVHGEFGLSLIMELIPQNDTIEKGQTVVTSAIESIIPPNLIIGTISAVEKRGGEIFQKTHITTPVYLDRVEIVSVIISRNE